MKKRVKILTAIAGHQESVHGLGDFAFAPGAFVTLPAPLADAWAKAGIAEIASDEPGELKAQIAELQARLKEAEGKK